MVDKDDRVEIGVGMSGENVSGVYSFGWDCESSPHAVKLLAKFTMVDDVWGHIDGEFERIREETESQL